MLGRKRFWVSVVLALLLTAAAGAQGETNGTLAVGQPSSMQMVSGEVFQFDYVIEQTSRVTLQAISGTAVPTISIQQDGLVVASEPNPNGQFEIALTTVLNGGNYVVEITGANNTSGLVILSVENQTPLNVTPLSLGVLSRGAVTQAEPVSVYEFGGLTETAFLYIDTFLQDRGVDVRIVNLTTGATAGSSGAEVLGARFQFGAGSAFYQVQIGGVQTESGTEFDLCLTLVRVGGCTGSGAPQPTAVTGQPTAAATPILETPACTVAPNASGGVNIRQSATTGSIVVGALPTGSNATVLGRSPDGSFFNIEFNGINGWVSAGVVTTTGDCSDLATVQPPAPIAPSPTPTATPIPATPTPSGPCVIHINSPTFVYTTTNEQVDDLYDQVQSGELIPVGRTSDNHWWQTNYAGSWIPTHVFGGTASVSGNCANLPIVSP